MTHSHRFNGECNIGHKLAKDLVTCEACGQLLSYPYGLHVNSRNKEALLAAHGMKWLPYTVNDFAAILAGSWDQNIYPWDR